MSSNISEFNIIVVGDSGVGKTTFIKLHKTGVFEKKYITTNTVGKDRVSFPISGGRFITFNIWNYSGDKDGFYCDNIVNAAIIMFDVTSESSYKSISFWYDSIRKKYPEIPIVFCVNKIDCDRNLHKVTDTELQLFTKQDIAYYKISTRLKININKPLMYISRKLLREDDLMLMSSVISS